MDGKKQPQTEWRLMDNICQRKIKKRNCSDSRPLHWRIIHINSIIGTRRIFNDLLNK